MSIEQIKWENSEYGCHPTELKVEFTSRTHFTNGEYEDRRVRISSAGTGYDIHTLHVVKKQPRAESTSDLSHVMLNVEHWHSAIGLTIHNMNDLADVLVEYNRRLQPMFRLRAGSPEEQLARTLGDGS